MHTKPDDAVTPLLDRWNAHRGCWEVYYARRDGSKVIVAADRDRRAARAAAGAGW